MKTILLFIGLILGMYVFISWLAPAPLSVQEQVAYRTCEVSGGIPMITSDLFVICVDRKTNVPR